MEQNQVTCCELANQRFLLNAAARCKKHYELKDHNILLNICITVCLKLTWNTPCKSLCCHWSKCPWLNPVACCLPYRQRLCTLQHRFLPYFYIVFIHMTVGSGDNAIQSSGTFLWIWVQLYPTPHVCARVRASCIVQRLGVPSLTVKWYKGIHSQH